MLTPQQRLAGLTPDLQQRVRAIELALQQQRFADAERDVGAALALAPRHAEVLRLHASVQLQRGNPQAAIDALQQAHALRPDDAMLLNALAGVFDRINDYDRARAALRRACELDAAAAPCWFNYGLCLFSDGDVSAAVPVLQRALELAPHDAPTRSLLADALAADGDVDAAIAQYRQIVASAPASGQAWWSLAVQRPLPLTADDVGTMQRVLAGGNIAEHDRVTISFALALALDAQGDYAPAFALMQRAHALAAKTEPCNAAEFASRVDDILAAFPAPAAAPAQGREAIFIVGMPRSGSTLTEQILASHSQVEGGAELVDLPGVIRAESMRLRQPFPQWAHAQSAEAWQALGQRYLQRTARRRRSRPFFTDKLPGNWLYVGAIAAMLPDARIVISLRDALETCFACYRYMFRRHPYTHTFADLAAHRHAFERAVRHWQALFPERVRIQSYEALVAEPETQIRELLEFCGLPFEPACLEFHANRRRVATPSASQVREPLRRDTARAAKYGALLDPLRAALAQST